MSLRRTWAGWDTKQICQLGPSYTAFTAELSDMSAVLSTSWLPAPQVPARKNTCMTVKVAGLTIRFTFKQRVLHCIAVSQQLEATWLPLLLLQPLLLLLLLLFSSTAAPR